MEERKILIRLQIDSPKEVADIVARRIYKYLSMNSILDEVVGNDCPIEVFYGIELIEYSSK